jgi:site-specific DNA recombinase
MVPSITTHTLKDGNKRKHRYYVCGVFHNKGSSACKANSVKAYDSEDAVINRITAFLNYSVGFSQTIEYINKDTVQSNVKLKEQLEKVETDLIEANAMQEK